MSPTSRMAPRPSSTEKKIAVLLTTVPTRRDASRIARRLLREQAAACCTIIDRATSMYVWRGKSETSHEVILLCKTSRRTLRRARTLLEECHPYDTPAVLVVHGEANASYAAWMESVQSPRVKKASR